MPSEEENASEINEHLLPLEEVASKLHTELEFADLYKSKGLSQAYVDEYIKLNGANALTPPPKPNPFIQYLRYLCGLFNLLLIFAGILSFILYGIDSSSITTIVLGAVLIVVAMINALLDFIQAYRTAALLDSFTKMIPANSEVLRDGVRLVIPAMNIVPGDFVFLKTGDKVPADVLLIISKEIKVDNSSLTGESEPQERSVSNVQTNPMEAANIVFNGTLIVAGEGAGLVIRIGDKTVLGQIAKLTLGGKKRESQLVKEIDFFVKVLATVAVITTIIFFIIGFARGYPASTNFTFAIGVFVSFVPEGLPLTVSILLTLAAKRLARKNVLVKDLHGVETLGSITMLATDKTGTLTQNRMTTAGVWMNAQFFDVTLDAKSSVIDMSGNTEVAFSSDVVNKTLLLHIFSLCSKCNVEPSEWQKPIHERIIFGDATESGLFRYAMEESDVSNLLQQYAKVCEIPFSSETKWHLTVHNYPHANGSFAIFLKGAPERVLAKCSNLTVADQTFPLTEELRLQFNGAYERFAGRGHRVLGFAYILLNSDRFPYDYIFTKEKEHVNFPLEGFNFLALASLIDPPKHGVRKAIATLKTAGVQVVMVTGDHPLTAKSIAQKIGLIEGETADMAALRLNISIDDVPEEEYDAIVVHGDSIDKFNNSDWDHLFSKKEIVFARTSPKQKLEIVTRAQDKGHIVGASGDGVNDAPALKKADLGISMNITGSDVSKEAAAMILLDDNFATIVIGIEQGRLLFANLKKSIRYTLTHIMPELLAFLFFIIFAIPLPISSLLILFIDLASELGPALSFAWEPAEKNLMLVPPRKVLAKAGKSYKQFRDETNLQKIEKTLTMELGQPTELVPLAPLPMTRTFTNTDLMVDASLDLKTAGDAPLPRASAFYTPSSFKKFVSKFDRSGKVDSKGKANDIDKVQQSTPENVNLTFKEKLAIYWAKIVGFFKKHFLLNETGESLVDGELLFWSYLQGGIFLTIGCYGAYLLQLFEKNVPINMLYNSALTYFQPGAPVFPLTDGTFANADSQLAILASAQSAYYLGIVIGQWFTLFIVKHRYAYPFGFNLFYNWRSLVAIVISGGIASIVVYVPFFNTILSSAPVDILPILVTVAIGMLYLSWEFVRRFLHYRGYLGGMPTQNDNLLDIVRTTTQI